MSSAIAAAVRRLGGIQDRLELPSFFDDGLEYSQGPDRIKQWNRVSLQLLSSHEVARRPEYDPRDGEVTAEELFRRQNEHRRNPNDTLRAHLDPSHLPLSLQSLTEKNLNGTWTQIYSRENTVPGVWHYVPVEAEDDSDWTFVAIRYLTEKERNSKRCRNLREHSRFCISKRQALRAAKGHKKVPARASKMVGIGKHVARGQRGYFRCTYAPSGRYSAADEKTIADVRRWLNEWFGVIFAGDAANEDYDDAVNWRKQCEAHGFPPIALLTEMFQNFWHRDNGDAGPSFAVWLRENVDADPINAYFFLPYHGLCVHLDDVQIMWYGNKVTHASQCAAEPSPDQSVMSYFLGFSKLSEEYEQRVKIYDQTDVVNAKQARELYARRNKRGSDGKLPEVIGRILRTEKKEKEARTKKNGMFVYVRGTIVKISKDANVTTVWINNGGADMIEVPRKYVHQVV